MRVCQQRLWSRKVPAAQPRSACVPQVSLRVCRQRSGRPAALLVQFGGGARGGRAAARESASRQRVCRPRILRGRHPGPKVKTIPPCTALSTHSCTVTILFKGVFFWGCFAFSLFIELQFCLFLYRYRYQYLESRHSSDNVGAAGNVSVCVFVFTSCPSATVHWVFVLPRSK